jgi:hypothetical protein
MEWAAVRCIPDWKDCALVAREAQCSELAAWTISNLEAIPNKPALHMADALDHIIHGLIERRAPLALCEDSTELSGLGELFSRLAARVWQQGAFIVHARAQL